MAIVKTMTQSDFQDAFKDEEFSYDATEALFNFYEEVSDSMEEPFEFDQVAIRCDWYEYDNLSQAYMEYEAQDSGNDTLGNDELMREYFEDRTTVIELDNGHVLLQAF